MCEYTKENDLSVHFLQYLALIVRNISAGCLKQDLKYRSLVVILTFEGSRLP